MRIIGKMNTATTLKRKLVLKKFVRRSESRNFMAVAGIIPSLGPSPGWWMVSPNTKNGGYDNIQQLVNQGEKV
jgi:myo-inositol catabolism protein IolC